MLVNSSIELTEIKMKFAMLDSPRARQPFAFFDSHGATDFEVKLRERLGDRDGCHLAVQCDAVREKDGWCLVENEPGVSLPLPRGCYFTHSTPGAEALSWIRETLRRRIYVESFFRELRCSIEDVFAGMPLPNRNSKSGSNAFDSR